MYLYLNLHHSIFPTFVVRVDCGLQMDVNSINVSDIGSMQGILDDLQSVIEQQMSMNASASQLSSAEIQTVVADLQRVDEKDIIHLGSSDSLCSICFAPYIAILSEEEMALAMDSPAHPIEELGLAKLAQSWQCGHIFCRRDITKWITSGHDSCPMCRRRFLLQTSEEPADTEAFVVNRPYFWNEPPSNAGMYS